MRVSSATVCALRYVALNVTKLLSDEREWRMGIVVVRRGWVVGNYTATRDENFSRRETKVELTRVYLRAYNIYTLYCARCVGSYSFRVTSAANCVIIQIPQPNCKRFAEYPTRTRNLFIDTLIINVTTKCFCRVSNSIYIFQVCKRVLRDINATRTMCAVLCVWIYSYHYHMYIIYLYTIHTHIHIYIVYRKVRADWVRCYI